MMSEHDKKAEDYIPSLKIYPIEWQAPCQTFPAAEGRVRKRTVRPPLPKSRMCAIMKNTCVIGGPNAFLSAVSIPATITDS